MCLEQSGPHVGIKEPQRNALLSYFNAIQVHLATQQCCNNAATTDNNAATFLRSAASCIGQHQTSASIAAFHLSLASSGFQRCCILLWGTIFCVAHFSGACVYIYVVNFILWPNPAFYVNSLVCFIDVRFRLTDVTGTLKILLHRRT